MSNRSILKKISIFLIPNELHTTKKDVPLVLLPQTMLPRIFFTKKLFSYVNGKV